MRKLQVRGVSAFLVGLALAAGQAGVAMAGGTVYSWRTEDGSYAFTDDEDAIPARYREQATERQVGRLADYERFTPVDDAATDAYEADLAQRVLRLRDLNAGLAQSHGVAQPQSGAPAATQAAATPSGELLTVRTGDVGLSFPTREQPGPIVSRSVLVRPEGKMVVENVRVTRRDGEVISVEMPRSREWNVTDAVDEADLHEALER